MSDMLRLRSDAFSSMSVCTCGCVPPSSASFPLPLTPPWTRSTHSGPVSACCQSVPSTSVAPTASATTVLAAPPGPSSTPPPAPAPPSCFGCHVALTATPTPSSGPPLNGPGRALLVFLLFFGVAGATVVAAMVAGSDPSVPNAPSAPSPAADLLCPLGRPGPAGLEGRRTVSHSSLKSDTRFRIRSMRSWLTPSPRSTLSHTRRSSPWSMVLRQRARRKP
mmetsp:Transcript_34035/g.81098  ORF Transcript_34035/g.81098 Transcript_34035/m.81098 type:complete len:221 (-) Transcript_34035:797-1459(-)